MKKKILDALKTKFEGVSENILSRVAEKLAKTVTTEEEVATAVEGVTLQQVIDSYGDSRATEAQRTAVRNYEEKHGLKDGKIVTTKTEEQENGSDDDVPAWAKSLIEAHKALSERLNKMDVEHTTASRKEKLNAIIAKLPDVLRKGYARISIDTLSDEDFDNLQEEIKTEVDAINKSEKTQGALFGRPKGNGSGSAKTEGQTATDEEVSAVVDRLNV